MCKTDIVKQAISGGDYQKALRIAKGFKMNITKQQNADITRAYECMVHPEFYKSLNYDIELVMQKGIDTLISLYGK